MESNTLSVEDFGKLSVVNEHHAPVKLSDLWQEKTAVLVFVRHFGWVFCRQQVAELATQAKRFTDKNARLIVIGSGDPRHFNEFREITGYKDQLFSDPSLTAFSLLKFSSSIAGFMSINSMFRAVLALKNGHRQGAMQGSVLQLGGAVVIDASGAVRYFFAGRKAGDHPPVDDLIRAVDN